MELKRQVKIKIDYKCQEVWVEITNPKSNLMERELVIIKVIKIKLSLSSDFWST